MVQGMNKTEIYINAYPRSGTAWLTRLLNDILPRDEYIVRRGHFTLRNGELSAGRFYALGDTGRRQNPKQLALSDITNEKLIFMVRDPRDICISGAWLWQQPVEQFLDRMIAGEVVRCGRWDKNCDRWLSYITDFEDSMSFVRYEGFLSFPIGEIGHTMWCLRLWGQNEIARAHSEPGRLLEIIERQSFAACKNRIGNDEKVLRKAGLRKGIVGDWRNHFTQEMNDKIWSEFGWMMERLGYKPENDFS